jgi:tRNA threonylcarbamoyladenosine biosynthesis protein TsaE
MERLATAMWRYLPSHLVIGLVGTLGAGKTTLVQAIARAAGIDSADVTSPTFTLLQTHRGTRTLHHLDAYRVADEDEFLELGVDELFEDESAWTLIEWADRVSSVLPQQTLWIEIMPVDQDRRLIRLTTEHPAIAQSIDQLAEGV